MQRADRTIASTLALSLALSGPLTAQQLAPGRDNLPGVAQDRFDEILAACEENGTVPEDLVGPLGDVDCDAIRQMDESRPPNGAVGTEAEVGDRDEPAVTPEAGSETDAEAGQPADENATGSGAASDGLPADVTLPDAADTAPQAESGGDAAPAATGTTGDEADVLTEPDGQADTEGREDTGVQSDVDAGSEADPEVSEDDLRRALEQDAAGTSDGESTPEDPEQADGGAGTETEAEAEPETDAEAEMETDAEVEPETDAEAETEADAEAETDAETETGAEAETETDAETETETDAEAEPETDAEAEPETDAEAETETEAETGADAQDTTDATETAPGPDDVAPIDAQEQADALAADEQDTAAAAAGTEGTAEPEATREVIDAEDVRQSSEDFTETISGRDGSAAETGATRDDGDDGDGNNTLRNAALLGLGAIALNEILRGNERVVSNTGDRVVIEDQGQLRVLRNDDVLLRRPGAEVQTYRYDDGSTRQVITYDDGTTVETVRAADGRALRRTKTGPDGNEVVLFDDTRQTENVIVNELPQTTERRRFDFQSGSEDELMAALNAAAPQGINRSFSLNQIRNIDTVRELVPEITVDTINFATGSAAIPPSEAQELAALGNTMRRTIERDPDEVFLIEGHTDAVGSAAYNLALSDRRAESLALALTEYFDVPPENLVLQGYGESDLLVETSDSEVRNRRAAVRRITPLLR